MRQTRHNENRTVTLDPAVMRGKYLVRPLKKVTKETVKDDVTGEETEFERTTWLLEAGTLIGDRELETIRFWIDEGSVKGVEVSDQRRLAVEVRPHSFGLYKATATIGRKNSSFILYGRSVAHACAVLSDFIELNYDLGYQIKGMKEIEDMNVIIDEYPETLPDEQEDVEDDVKDDVKEEDERKTRFYQITALIWRYENADALLDDPDTAPPFPSNFIVQAESATEATAKIERYVTRAFHENELKRALNDPDAEIETPIFRAAIEESKILNVEKLVPLYFTEAPC